MYLVRLVVILRVVFKDLWLLRILEVSYKVIYSKFYSPFFAIDEPEGISNGKLHVS